MVKYIKGIYRINTDSGIVVENESGIGFYINVPKFSPIYKNEIGEKITVYTELVVRENDLSLYGFHNMETLSLFNLLKTVSGIGPKGAMAILDTMPVDMLKNAIKNKDVTAISKANGVGKKTAERLVLELSEKVDADSDIQYFKLNEEKEEALNALISLGYSKVEASDAINQIKENDLSSESYIKLALKNII